jgi:hypothetical protein
MIKKITVFFFAFLVSFTWDYFSHDTLKLLQTQFSPLDYDSSMLDRLKDVQSMPRGIFIYPQLNLRSNQIETSQQWQSKYEKGPYYMVIARHGLLPWGNFEHYLSLALFTFLLSSLFAIIFHYTVLTYEVKATLATLISGIGAILPIFPMWSHWELPTGLFMLLIFNGMFHGALIGCSIAWGFGRELTTKDFN